MQYRELGRTGIKVSAVGFGGWAIGGPSEASGTPLGWGRTTDEESLAAIRRARDLGVTFFDTADSYGFGRSESLLGIVLSRKREDVVIATKVGVVRGSTGTLKKDFSRQHIFVAADGSLKRLRTDYIDLYQVHWPDPLVPIEETADAMRALYQQGKIRAIGVSNFSVEQMERFRKVAPLHVLQPPYNLFERDIEAEILPYCHRTGIATLGYGALCRGLLSGRMRADTVFGGDDLRRLDPKFQPPRFTQYLTAVQRLDRLARDSFHRRVIHLAVRWMLDQGISAALWGGRRPDQLQPTIPVAGWTLAADVRAKIDRILSQTITDPVGPEFMAPLPRGLSDTPRDIAARKE
jgi:aryl-alcohol dehydrogenase-like predicted oxidoreductase